MFANAHLFVVRKRSKVKNVCSSVRPPKYCSLYRIGGTHTLAHKLVARNNQRLWSTPFRFAPFRAAENLVVARLMRLLTRTFPTHAMIVIYSSQKRCVVAADVMRHLFASTVIVNEGIQNPNGLYRVFGSPPLSTQT